MLQTRQAYYAVQAQEAQVTSSQGVVDASQENVRVTQAQVNVGTAPQFNLLQAQSQLAVAQQTLTQSKAAAVSAEYTLDAVLNLPLSTVVAPTTPFGLPQPPPDLNALIQTGLSERAEIQEGAGGDPKLPGGDRSGEGGPAAEHHGHRRSADPDELAVHEQPGELVRDDRAHAHRVRRRADRGESAGGDACSLSRRR